MSKFKDWVMDEQQKEEELNGIEDEISQMTVNDFSNLVDSVYKHTYSNKEQLAYAILSSAKNMKKQQILNNFLYI